MKKIYLVILYLTISFSSFTEEGYTFQELYKIEVELEDTDRLSINRGMGMALRDLMVNLSGSSEIDKDKAIRKAINDPEGYVSEYRLSSIGEKIFGTFSFNRELVRKLLSDNNLPVWIGIKPKALLFLPCKSQFNYLTSEQGLLSKHNQLCTQTKKNLVKKASSRNIIFIEPSLDLTDLMYIDLYQPKLDNNFLDKIALRYGLSDWIICYIKDKFGVLSDQPNCISPISSLKSVSLDQTVEIIANELSKDFQLNVNPHINTKVKLLISGIDRYSDLVFLEDIIKSNALVISYSLISILGATASYELNIKGKKSDLEKLMNVNPLLVNQLSTKDVLGLEYFFKGSSE